MIGKDFREGREIFPIPADRAMRAGDVRGLHRDGWAVDGGEAGGLVFNNGSMPQCQVSSMTPTSAATSRFRFLLGSGRGGGSNSYSYWHRTTSARRTNGKKQDSIRSRPSTASINGH
jgi:hypothetical protein